MKCCVRHVVKRKRLSFASFIKIKKRNKEKNEEKKIFFHRATKTILQAARVCEASSSCSEKLSVMFPSTTNLLAEILRFTQSIFLLQFVVTEKRLLVKVLQIDPYETLNSKVLIGCHLCCKLQ